MAQKPKPSPRPTSTTTPRATPAAAPPAAAAPASAAPAPAPASAPAAPPAAAPAAPAPAPAPTPAPAAEPAPYTARIGRIPIRHLSPRQPEDRWPSKAVVGEVVPFAATVFREGHDKLGADLVLVAPDGARQSIPLSPGAKGSDRWHAQAQLDAEGTWHWHVLAYTDDWATWHHNATVKIEADVDVEVMLLAGAQLLERAAALAKGTPDQKVLRDARTAIMKAKSTPAARLGAANDPRVTAALSRHRLASLETESEQLAIRVERARAGVGSWYEFFPRSEGAVQRKDGSWASGTFTTAARRLPAVAQMGFDVLYLPPIHPIGRVNRKGPNNTLTPGPNDPGSPWAIGSSEGGHDAIHPDLGTLDDFRAFVGAAKKLGIEVAIDLALQCAPDHPWVSEHPEWFTTLPDGSIAYAENPPKKYQDIYPVNFDNDPQGIRAEVLRIVRHWIAQGVTIFRVDNPHTKPLDFWEWLLHEIDARAARRRVPRRGLHPPRDDAVAGRCRVPAVVHVLHLAQHEGRARGVPHRAVAGDERLLPTEPVRQHPRHPHRVPAVRRRSRVQGARRDRRHGEPDLGRVRRLRAHRERRAPRQRGEHRQREVRVQGARLGLGRRPRPARSRRT